MAAYFQKAWPPGLANSWDKLTTLFFCLALLNR
jgi:hypothetical protein